MCGYLGNVSDSPLTQALMRILGMTQHIPQLRNNPGSGPASSIDIILHNRQGLSITPALWWLLLQINDQGVYRPSRYTSFNTRYDKLEQKGSAGYLPYRQSRCIVPASYFIEGEGKKGSRTYHRIEPSQHAFALGGLFRTWISRATGECVYSCSVITLAPHPSDAWRRVHSQSTPLILPAQPDILQRWLDPAFDQVAAFQPLLTPAFHQPIRCTPIERPGEQRVIGDSVSISDSLL
jgi:putative SOS response-associated peptidase YedK